MKASAQEVYDFYRRGDKTQDLYPFAPFLRHKAKGNILEIGVRYGVSTASFLSGVTINGGHVYSVDVDPKCGELFEDPNWTFLLINSLCVDTVSSRIDGELDVLFIDGDHTHPAVDSDLFEYSKLVRKGGLILLHDIVPPATVTDQMIKEGWGTEDVRDAYHQYIRETNSVHFELPGEFGLGVIYKR